MFAEKEQLVSDLEAFGSGKSESAIPGVDTTEVDTKEVQPNTDGEAPSSDNAAE